MAPAIPHAFSSGVLEQTRSAVWPLMAALVIGLAIGFAGGYGIGTTREHPVTSTTDARPVTSQPATVAPVPVPPGRDATEIAVAPKPATPTAQRQSPGATTPQKPRSPAAPERRTAPLPERHANARSAPERPAAQAATRPPGPAPAGTSGELVGRLSVDSRPVGARVFLDDRPIGLTPVAMPNIRTGDHAIRLERDGYRHWTSTVRIVTGEQSRVTASLDRP